MRSKPIIEDVLDKVRCPQFGYDDYGEWGALRFNQRLEIKELCDYAQSLEKYYEEHERKSKNMSKEEYAESWYLLGKLKYAIAEDMVNIPSSVVRDEQQRILDSIHTVTRVCVIDGDDKKTSIN